MVLFRREGYYTRLLAWMGWSGECVSGSKMMWKSGAILPSLFAATVGVGLRRRGLLISSALPVTNHRMRWRRVEHDEMLRGENARISRVAEQVLTCWCGVVVRCVRAGGASRLACKRVGCGVGAIDKVEKLVCVRRVWCVSSLSFSWDVKV